ncbi:MAG: hypothetical protein QN131_06060 [Armatimonadota bacterium]|nr:hypothetical protein [Armatimonadota bacterium]
MTQSGWIVVGFVLVVLGLVVLSHLIRTVNRRPFTWLRRVLETPVGLPLPAQDPAALYYRRYPPRLHVNWLALILGPVWYLLVGLWVHASIMGTLLFVSGGLLAPFVWLYCGLKADEDLLEFRVARDSVY